MLMRGLYESTKSVVVLIAKELKKVANIPVNKALYSRVKSEAKRKFAVYPSAYANAWLVREYKKRGGTYRSGTKKRGKK